MNTTTLAKTDQAEQPLATLETQLDARLEQFRTALPSHISVEKFQQTVLAAVRNSPELLAADRRSFINSVLKAAQDGLMPDGHEAALVIYNTRHKDPQRGWVTLRLVQYLPMVFGIQKKIRASGEIKKIETGIVYQQELDAGRFVYEQGSNPTLRHKPLLDRDFKPTDDDIALAYSKATFDDDDETESYEVMRRWEIDKVREASTAGATLDRNGQPREAKGPWVDWFSEMARKTVLRRHAKSLPQSSDIILRDVEGQELQAAASAMALLGSREPDQPRLEQSTGNFDQTTGEIEAEPGKPEWPVDDPNKPQKPSEVEPRREPEIPSDVPHETPQTEPQTPSEEPEEPSEEKDDIGLTKTPSEKLAERYINAARECELLVDLKKLEKGAQFDLGTMPVEFAECVNTEFEKARLRLTPVGKAGA
jgi:recombination protein RecT